MAPAGGVDLVEVPERPVETTEERKRIGAEHAHRRPPARDGSLTFAVESSHGDDHPVAPDHVGEDGVVAGQPPQSGARVRSEARDQLRQAARRQPVRLGHHDVERDRGRLPLGDAGDERREPGPRPRPLAVMAQARVIDRDDERRRRAADTWGLMLVGVEGRQTQRAEERDPALGHQEQEEQQREQDEAERPPARAPQRAEPSSLGPVRALGVAQGRAVRGRSPGHPTPR